MTNEQIKQALLLLANRIDYLNIRLNSKEEAPHNKIFLDIEGLLEDIFAKKPEDHSNEKKEKFVPDTTDGYWFINNYGGMSHANMLDSSDDTARINFGNVFRTKEEAEAARDKIKSLLQSL